MKAALCFLLHFPLAFLGVWPTCPFCKQEVSGNLQAHIPNPPFLDARKGGLASTSPASPAGVPSPCLHSACAFSLLVSDDPSPGPISRQRLCSDIPFTRRSQASYFRPYKQGLTCCCQGYPTNIVGIIIPKCTIIPKV